jgi:hypothetical protein
MSDMMRFLRGHARTVAMTYALSASSLLGQTPHTTDPIAIRHRGLAVEVLDSAGRARALWTASDAGQVANEALSPSGAYATASVWSPGVHGEVRYAVDPAPTLIVIRTNDGEVVRSIPGVIHATWCGEDCLALVYGHYMEEAPGGARGDSFAILTPSTGERRRMALQGIPLESLWNRGDSTVLVLVWTGAGDRVARVNVTTGTVSSTHATSLSISPSGRYFFAAGDEGEPYVLREMSTGAVVPWPGQANTLRPMEWSGTGDRLLLRTETPRRTPPRSGSRDRSAGVRLLTGDRNPEQEFRLWEPETGRLSRPWRGRGTEWRQRTGLHGTLMQVRSRLERPSHIASMEAP